MKSFLRNLAIFSIFAAGCYIIFLLGSFYIFPKRLQKNVRYIPRAEGYLFERLAEADSTKNIDVLILGSSHAYRGYDTRKFRQLGLRAFNLGSSAQTPVQTHALLSQYLSRFRPRFVILDIFPILLSGYGVESTVDIISNGRSNRETVLMALSSKDLKVYNTLLLDILIETFGLTSLKDIKPNSHDKYISGGYVESQRLHNPSATVNLSSRYNLHEDQLDAVRNIIDLLKQNKIPFIISQAPIRSDKYQAVANNKQVDSILASFGAYHNFNKTIQLSDSFFLDGSHLNQRGVDVFNTHLLKLLPASMLRHGLNGKKVFSKTLPQQAQ